MGPKRSGGLAGTAFLSREECGPARKFVCANLRARRGKKVARTVDLCPPIRDAPLMSGVERSKRQRCGCVQAPGIFDGLTGLAAREMLNTGCSALPPDAAGARPLPEQMGSSPVVFDALARLPAACQRGALFDAEQGRRLPAPPSDKGLGIWAIRRSVREQDG